MPPQLHADDQKIPKANFTHRDVVSVRSLQQDNTWLIRISSLTSKDDDSDLQEHLNMV